jgi:carbon monoxide dehydrogenase subunit G
MRGLEAKRAGRGVTDYVQSVDAHTTVIHQVTTTFEGPAASHLTTRIESSLPVAFMFPTAIQSLATRVRDGLISCLEEHAAELQAGASGDWRVGEAQLQ